jgi:hypothetical protein
MVHLATAITHPRPERPAPSPDAGTEPSSDGARSRSIRLALTTYRRTAPKRLIGLRLPMPKGRLLASCAQRSVPSSSNRPAADFPPVIEVRYALDLD